jgi:hypothetical protein
MVEEIERMRKEVIVAQFTRHMLGQTEKNCEKSVQSS